MNKLILTLTALLIVFVGSSKKPYEGPYPAKPNRPVWMLLGVAVGQGSYELNHLIVSNKHKNDVVLSDKIYDWNLMKHNKVIIGSAILSITTSLTTVMIHSKVNDYEEFHGCHFGSMLVGNFVVLMVQDILYWNGGELLFYQWLGGKIFKKCEILNVQKITRNKVYKDYGYLTKNFKINISLI